MKNTFLLAASGSMRNAPALHAGFRALFLGMLALTLALLLAPGSAIQMLKTWVISWLPLAASVDNAPSFLPVDKLVHFTLFTLLGAFGVCNWPSREQRGRLFFCLLLLGALTEFLQLYIPDRSAELGDLAADASGAALGLIARRRGKR